MAGELLDDNMINNLAESIATLWEVSALMGIDPFTLRDLSILKFKERARKRVELSILSQYQGQEQ